MATDAIVQTLLALIVFIWFIIFIGSKMVKKPMTEFVRDIMSSPDSKEVPASQKFQKVWQERRMRI